MRDLIKGSFLTQSDYAKWFNFLIGESMIFELWVFRIIAELKVPVLPRVKFRLSDSREKEYDFFYPYDAKWCCPRRCYGDT